MSKHGKQSKKQSHKAKSDKGKSDVIVVKKITSKEETVIVNEDSKGNLVLTPEDKKRLETVKTLQAKAKQANIDAKEAKAKAIEAIQALDGSDAIKAIKQDIEARLSSQEAIVTEKRASLDKEIETLNSIQAEYQALTGIDKKVKASKSKGKTGNGNGKFETTVKQDKDSIAVIVKHKDTNNVFEYSLFPSNGKISKEDWLKLRHSLTAQFEKETKEENLTIRAYLSNLKTKIEAIKAIV